MPVRFSLLAALLVLLPTRASAGPLQDIEDSGRHGSRDDEASARHSYDGEEDDDDDDDDDDDGESSPFWGYLFLAPWLVPRLAHDPCIDRFAPYPYADGRGHLRIEPLTEGCAPSDVPLPASRRVAAQVAFEGGYALTGVGAGGVDARLQLSTMELSGRISLLTDFTEPSREQALSGTTHFSVRFAQAAHVDFRTGLGLRAYGLRHALYGLDVLYGIDIFGARPITSHLEFHLGSLGKAATGQVRITLGTMVHNIELYAGWDHTSIWIDDRTTRLSGPLLGARAWF